MLKSEDAQRFSESYESESLSHLTKEHDPAPDLRAPRRLRFASNPCNLTSNATAAGKGLRGGNLRKSKKIIGTLFLP